MHCLVSNYGTTCKIYTILLTIIFTKWCKFYYFILSRWALFNNLRSDIAEKTHDMFRLVQDDTYFHNESASKRIVRDNKDEELLISVFEQHHVFSPKSHLECLVSIATNDLATIKIRETLLSAEDMRQKQVGDFVQQRLTEPLQQQPNSSKVIQRFNLRIQCTRTMPLHSICFKSPKGANRKKKTPFYGLIGVLSSYRCLRVLSHELMSVPISLANTNGKLGSGQKVLLADVLNR